MAEWEQIPEAKLHNLVKRLPRKVEKRRINDHCCFYLTKGSDHVSHHSLGQNENMCVCVCVREGEKGKDVRQMWQMLECNLRRTLVFSKATEVTWVTVTKTSEPTAAGGTWYVCVVSHMCICYVCCIHVWHMIVHRAGAWSRDSQLSWDSHAKSVRMVDLSLSLHFPWIRCKQLNKCELSVSQIDNQCSGFFMSTNQMSRIWTKWWMRMPKRRDKDDDVESTEWKTLNIQ